MSRRPADPAPVPLEVFCQQFDDDFRTVNQRTAFRRYLEGFPLPAERNKTLTALPNAEPISGAHQPGVQRLQWFLSEPSWQPMVINRRRLALLRRDPRTAPTAQGVLVIDEHGDRKWGTKTAHVGQQYVGCIGTVENAVVSVTSLWADARLLAGRCGTLHPRSALHPRESRSGLPHQTPDRAGLGPAGGRLEDRADSPTLVVNHQSRNLVRSRCLTCPSMESSHPEPCHTRHQLLRTLASDADLAPQATDTALLQSSILIPRRRASILIPRRRVNIKRSR